MPAYVDSATGSPVIEVRTKSWKVDTASAYPLGPRSAAISGIAIGRRSESRRSYTRGVPMSLPCADVTLPLCHTDAPPTVPRRTVRPLQWALATLFAGCGPSSGDGDDLGTGASTDGTDATATATATGPGTTGPGTSASSSDSSGPVDPTLADSSSGTDDTGTTGDETAADGCWDHSGFLDSMDYDGSGVEPFVCPGLPIPCAPVELHFVGESDCEAGTYAFGEATLADLAGTEAAARCVLESMRDGEPAEHAITLAPGGYETVPGRYVVLDAGVVTEISWFEDKAGSVDQWLLAPRDTAWFDACLAAPDLHGLVPCLWPARVPALGQSGATPCGDGPFGPVDLDACVGEEPVCP